MAEWTSISVTQEQKDRLEAEKPDGMTMGVWLIEVIDSHNTDIETNENGGEVAIDTHELAEQLEEDLEISVDYAEIEHRLEKVLERVR